MEWKGNMVFQATPPSGVVFTMDSHPELGGQGAGPTPLEAMIASVAACSAMDVLSILQKKQQVVHSYRIEVETVRGPEGVFPRPVSEFKLKHIVSGEGIDPAAVARAVQLSDEKYCSVAATLRQPPQIATEWVIQEALGTPVV